MVDQRRSAGQLFHHRSGSAEGWRIGVRERPADIASLSGLGLRQHESYAVPHSPRLYPVVELPAGQPVLAIPMDRGRLAARSLTTSHDRGRPAGPPPSSLKAGNRRRLPPNVRSPQRPRVAPYAGSVRHLLAPGPSGACCRERRTSLKSEEQNVVETTTVGASGLEPPPALPTYHTANHPSANAAPV